MKFDVHSKLDFAEPSAIRAERTRLLNEQVEYCRRNSPYYRRMLAKFPAKPLTLESLAELPTTSKTDLAEHNEEFTALPADRISDISFTSGTTGRPCRICYSADDLVRLGCNDARGYLAAGMRAGDRVLHRKFGVGVVQEVRGKGADARIVISFTAYGTKEFSLAIAPIAKVEE